MGVQEKAWILTLVTDSHLPRRRALAQLGLPKSTYYRWLKRQAKARLEDKKDGSRTPWNKLRPEEESKIISWELYKKTQKLFTELKSLKLSLQDELAIVILRRIVPGRCKYCPI